MGVTLSDITAASSSSNAPADVTRHCNGIVAKACDWSDCGKAIERPRPNQRFCSEACRNAWHDLHRPRIASAAVGHPRAGTIKALVLGILQSDGGGKWFSAHQLAQMCYAGEHSVKARLSELRRAGHPIEEDLPNGSSRRPHRYRMVTR